MEVRAFRTGGEACAKAPRQVEECRLRQAKGRTGLLLNRENKREYGVIETSKVGKD